MEKGEKVEKSGQKPTDVFEFEVELRLECAECHGVKYKKEKNTYLMV